MEKLDNVENADLTMSRWPLGFTITLLFLFAVYTYRYLEGRPHPGDIYGLTAGIGAFIFMIGLASYRLRKIIYNFPLGMLRTWLRSHIYIGFLCLALVFIHSGFSAKGIYSGLTLFLFIALIVSGAIGGMLYKIMPVSHSKNSRPLQPKEGLLEEIKETIGEADALAIKTSAEFQRAYRERIRPLMAKRPSFFSRFNYEESVVTYLAHETFDPLSALVPKEELYDFQALAQLYVEKEHLALRYAQLESMQWWLFIHAPLTAAALTAVIIHIISIVYF